MLVLSLISLMVIFFMWHFSTVLLPGNCFWRYKALQKWWLYFEFILEIHEMQEKKFFFVVIALCLCFVFYFELSDARPSFHSWVMTREKYIWLFWCRLLRIVSLIYCNCLYLLRSLALVSCVVQHYMVFSQNGRTFLRMAHHSPWNL